MYNYFHVFIPHHPKPCLVCCLTHMKDGHVCPCRYHISLVELLAACAEGKNVYTEIKCTSLLPLEDVVRVVTHEDCITEVQSLCVHVSVFYS